MGHGADLFLGLTVGRGATVNQVCSLASSFQ
jgi:hypothetical protein